MDKEQIRKALDHFENDKYVDAQDILKKEIQIKRDAFLKDKLSLDTDFGDGTNDQDQNNKGDDGDDNQGE